MAIGIRTLSSLVATALCCWPLHAAPPQRYVIDAANSAVSARVAFMGLASKTAHFPQVSGEIRLDPLRPETVALDVTLDARALRAGDAETLRRLKSPAFFDVERHPAIRLTGETMRMTGPRTAEIAARLTARGVSRAEMLRVTFERDPAQTDPGAPIAFTGTMAINRRNYGMTAYSLIVGNTVNIAIRARMVPG